MINCVIKLFLFQFSFFGILTFFGCKFSENEKIDNKLDLKKIVEKRIEIDSLTGHYHNSMLHNVMGGKSYLSLVNQHASAIYCYNWQSGKQVTKIPFTKEGSMSVGVSDIFGHTFINNDSLFIYNPDEMRLYLVNKLGSVIRRNVFPKSLIEFYGNNGYPKVTSSSGIKYLGAGKYVLPTSASVYKVKDYTKVNCGYLFDIHDTSYVKPLFQYPEIYNTGNWGDYLPFLVYTTINTSDSILVSSFPCDDSLTITSLATFNITRKFAGSRSFSSYNRKPLTKDPGKEWEDREAQQMFDFTSQLYNTIVFDSENGYYYRIVKTKPATKEEIYKQGGNFRKGHQFSVIALNSQFEIIGEYELPIDRYNFECVFSVGGSLFILLHPSQQKSEMHLTFDEYQLVPKL